MSSFTPFNKWNIKTQQSSWAHYVVTHLWSHLSSGWVALAWQPWDLSGSDLQIEVETTDIGWAWILALGLCILWDFPQRSSGPHCKFNTPPTQWLKYFLPKTLEISPRTHRLVPVLSVTPDGHTKPLWDPWPWQVLFPLAVTFFLYILTWLNYSCHSSSGGKVTFSK